MGWAVGKIAVLFTLGGWSSTHYGQSTIDYRPWTIDYGLRTNKKLQFVNQIILTLANMYIIKVKGVAKIPDYVQLRDDKFTLLAYFRVDRPEKALDKVGLGEKTEYIMNVVKDLPFGQILKLEI